MTSQSLRFKIAQLRQKSLLSTLESIAVIIFALFVAAYLPQLLIQFVYADAQLLEAPAILKFIPVAAFVLGVGYNLIALFANLRRGRFVKQLEQELEDIELLGDDCACGDDCCKSHTGESKEDWDDLEDLEKLVDEAIAEAETEEKTASAEKTEVKKSTSKTNGKTASKKSSDKKKTTSST